MNFKICILLTLLFVVPFSGLTQNLDDVFDDGDKDSKFYIGTSLNVLTTGTLNAYVDFFPIERLKLNVGLGFMPFDKFRDYSYQIPSDQDFGSVFNNLSGGTYYNFGLAVLSGLEMIVDFDYYYYINLRNRNFSIDKESLNIKHNKLSFGLGYMAGLFDRFNLDLMLGLSLGRERLFLLGNSMPNSTNSAVGFEANISLNYAL